MYEARDYDYLLTILKTPMGYLTQNGFSQDITSNELVVLGGFEYGNYSSMRTRIQFFIEKTNLSELIIQKLYNHELECEIIAYRCIYPVDCKNCPKCTLECEFWNSNREKLKLFKLYYF